MSDTPWPPALQRPDSPLTDGIVLLDELTFDDVPRVIAGCRDADSQHWLPLPSPYSEADARAFIGSRASAAASGNELTFAIRGVDDGVLAGAIGLSQRGYRHEADIGYWTSPDRRGRGWTARAVRLLAHYALTTMPLRRVEILAAVENTHSQGVARAAGGVFEGVRRRGMPTRDDEDAAVFSFIRTDFDEPAIQPPEQRPYIEGRITEARAGDDRIVLLVAESGSRGNKANVDVTADTVVVREFTRGYEPASSTDLHEGQQVAVWTTGPVRESFPVQVQPNVVVIRKR